MIYRKGKNKSLKEKYASGERKSSHAMEEFGPGQKEFIFCPHNEAVYFKKSWHHIEKFFIHPPKFLEKKFGKASPPNLKGDKNIRFRLCPAHEMAKNKQYEGEIIIKNIPEKFKEELVRLIENMGDRAMKLDVLDRILELRVKKQELRITTTENQLAQKIANKIGEVFKKKVSIKISRGKSGDVVRVVIIFTKSL